jgi:putative redox protein
MPPERFDFGNADGTASGTVIVRETQNGKFQQEIIAGAHRLLADEPTDVGGLDSGPGPTICCLPHSAPARR